MKKNKYGMMSASCILFMSAWKKGVKYEMMFTGCISFMSAWKNVKCGMISTSCNLYFIYECMKKKISME